jgi:hypothetical protein
MSAPRSAPRLFAATLGLYRQFPALFFFLAAAVIVPYELIALAATGSGPFSRSDASVGAQWFLILADWVLVTPLISALHVHAVAEVRHGREPQIGPVARRGLAVLPVVAAATIISSLGIALGFIALIVPGIYLTLHWAVVAQAAAIEHEGWLPALRRSGQLSDGHYVHIAIFLIMVGVIATGPAIVGDVALGNHGANAAVFVIGLVVEVITTSFAALASALLYYDLLARLEPSAEPAGVPRPSMDPRDYSDLDRPKGWYVDPEWPKRMRHWGGSDSPIWSGTTRTPRKIRQAWGEGDEDAAP